MTYLGIYRLYYPETFTSMSLWKIEVNGWRHFFNVYWSQQTWFLVCKIHISHVTKRMALSINVFCQGVGHGVNIIPWVELKIPGGFPSCFGSNEKQTASRIKSNMLLLLKNFRNSIYISEKESSHDNWKSVNNH